MLSSAFRLLLCAAALVFLAGCDGVVQVEGRLVRPPAEQPVDDCTALLFRASDERRLARRRVDESFFVSFTVFPWKREYFVEVTCDGYSTYRSAPFTSRARLGDAPIELGEIHLRPAEPPAARP